jgi:hypothetical protein
VGDPNERQSEVYNLLNRWVQSDPTTASAVVQQSALSDQQKSELMQRVSANH